MPRKPAPKPDDQEQSKRFIETAEEEVGADTDDQALECAFKKTASDPKPTASRSRPSGKGSGEAKA
jgi:hypothetical protein